MKFQFPTRLSNNIIYHKQIQPLNQIVRYTSRHSSGLNCPLVLCTCEIRIEEEVFFFFLVRQMHVGGVGHVQARPNQGHMGVSFPETSDYGWIMR